MTMDAPIPPVTVAICTINRLPFLKRAVEGALHQLEAYPKAELWVIDNGSSDGTQDYLAGLAAQSDRVHWAHEPRRAKGGSAAWSSSWRRTTASASSAAASIRNGRSRRRRG